MHLACEEASSAALGQWRWRSLGRHRSHAKAEIRTVWLGWLEQELGVTFSTTARSSAISTRVSMLAVEGISIAMPTSPEMKMKEIATVKLREGKGSETKPFLAM